MKKKYMITFFFENHETWGNLLRLKSFSHIIRLEKRPKIDKKNLSNSEKTREPTKSYVTLID